MSPTPYSASRFLKRSRSCDGVAGGGPQVVAIGCTSFICGVEGANGLGRRASFVSFGSGGSFVRCLQSVVSCQ